MFDMNTEAMVDGIPIAVVGLLIVFAVLIFLSLVFLALQKKMTSEAKKSLEKQGHNVKGLKDEDLNVPADENAAISTALFLYFSEQHIEESGIITIKQIDRRYSPWSSKIYSLNNMNFPR
jgi:glutaconyl-CoA/methylmalonyl-CoA decarboxylase subunit delta